MMPMEFSRRRTMPCTLPNAPGAIEWSSAVRWRRPSPDQPRIKRFVRFELSDQYQNLAGAAVGEVAAITAHAVPQRQEARKPLVLPSQFSVEQLQEQQCVLAIVLESCEQFRRLPRKEQGAALEREARHHPHAPRNQNGSGQH